MWFEYPLNEEWILNERLWVYLMFTLCKMGQHQIKKSGLKQVGKKVDRIS